jgi:hypothetical protein
MKPQNLQRVLATVTGTATPENYEAGIYGSKFFALLRLIEGKGEPIQCEAGSKLHGLKALQVEPGKWVAVERIIYKGGFSKCTWFLLAAIDSSRPKFKEGDRVHYTNPQGVYFGERTILKAEHWQREYGNQWRYFISDSDSPWYPVAESSLYPAPHRFFTIGSKSGYIESAGNAASFYYLQSLFLVRKQQNQLTIIK